MGENERENGIERTSNKDKLKSIVNVWLVDLKQLEGYLSRKYIFLVFFKKISQHIRHQSILHEITRSTENDFPIIPRNARETKISRTSRFDPGFSSFIAWPVDLGEINKNPLLLYIKRTRRSHRPKIHFLYRWFCIRGAHYFPIFQVDLCMRTEYIRRK